MNPFASWTQFQVDEHNRRLAGKPPAQPNSDGVEMESELHGDIMDYCRSKGWICLTGSMAHRTHRVIGELDMTVVADGGRVYFCELKAKGRKATPEQNAMIAWLHRLGCRARIIYNMEQFLDFTNPNR